MGRIRRGASNGLKVVLVAAPLTARSGVYRSARELIEEARSRGLDWSLFLGMDQQAKGSRPESDPPWIVEESVNRGGVRGVLRLRQKLLDQKIVRDADVIISLIPQCDMALALTRRPWIAYFRGQPWPMRSESSTLRRLFWQIAEITAVQTASEYWCTTSVLQIQLKPVGRTPEIVSAGVKPVARTWDGSGTRDTVVWVARFNHDKNPFLFLEIMRGLPLKGVMYGSGPLEKELRKVAPSNVTIAGWGAPETMWDDAAAYVGTSLREAFGRSAVEAAMSGVPIVLAESFGAADLLITDSNLASRFLLPAENLEGWKNALLDLSSDDDLRMALSQHAWEASQQLSIASSVDVIVDKLSPSAGLSSVAARRVESPVMSVDGERPVVPKPEKSTV